MLCFQLLAEDHSTFGREGMESIFESFQFSIWLDCENAFKGTPCTPNVRGHQAF
jgi:hypothetical protein